jgi:prepilin-type processing-associated H-X9-DG protein
MHNHHDQQGAFPHGQYAGWANNSPPSPPAPTTGASVTWGFLLLPYMDEQPAYDVVVNFLLANAGSPADPTAVPPVAAVAATKAYSVSAHQRFKFKEFMCPSDPNSGNVKGEGFHSNYAGCNGNTLFWDNTTVLPKSGGEANNGVLLAGKAVRMAMITDGGPQTLMVSENMVWAAGDDRRGRMFNSYQGETLFSTLYSPNTAAADVQYSCGTALPSFMPCTAVTGNPNSIQSARSYHNGRAGVNAVMCDGSVRWVSNSIIPETWTAMGSRDGGEAFAD